MGILASRKREDDASPECHLEEDCIFKRPRFPDSNTRASFTALKIFNLSEKPEHPRRLHAPVRISRFSRPSKMPDSTSSSMFTKPQNDIISLFHGYEQAKEEAISSLRCPSKEGLDKRIGRRNDVPQEFGSKNVETVELGGNKRMREQGAAENSHEDTNAMAIEKVGSYESSAVIDEVHVMSKEDVANAMESKKLDRVSDSTEPVYKRMLKDISNKNEKTSLLNSLIQLFTDSLNLIRSARPSRKERVAEYFVPLTEEDEVEVANAMSNRNSFKVLAVHETSNVDITGEKLQCLRNGAWLNDEVINVYLALLKERENREPGKFLKCHFFNTFFYKKLISGKDGYDFRSVRRWTSQKKLGYSLLECEKIFVPIHREVHWCLAIINKKAEKFQYLDSLRGYDPNVLNVLARYFVDEAKDKGGQDIDVSSWEHEFVDDLPEQKNGYDCGVFMIKYADFHSRGIGLCFSQDHMQYFRRRTAKEILKLRAE